MRSTRRFAALLGPMLVVGGVTACVPEPPAPKPPVIHSFDTAGGPFADPAVVPLSWEVSDPNGDDLTCRLDTDGDGSWELVLSPCQAAGSRNASVGEGTRTATLEVSDGEHSVTATTDHSVTAGPTETYDIDARLVSASDAALQAAIDEAVGRWEAVLARGVPDEVVTMASGCLFAPGIDELVDDIVVTVLATELPSGYFGDAAPCAEGSDGLPRFANVRISEDIIDTWATDGRLGDLLTHEFGHALGFGAPRWWAFLDGLGTDELTWTGPRGVAEWSALGGTGPIPMEPLNPDHWEERRFGTELMTCFVWGTSPLPMSAMTVAAMADIGYHVDLSAAGPFTLPPLGPPGHC
ncbi:MAG: hypothetical protein M9942_00920 [Microthrixaceae bacterium]|nr:hypothetical protein [Microthrixaceae bacterium]